MHTDEQSPFDTSEFKLLCHGLSLMPELELAVFAGKLARERLQFPINASNELASLFDPQSGTATFKGRTLSLNDVEKYMLKEYFPIIDEFDFVGKALLGLTRGSLVHSQELKLRLLNENSFADTVILPGFSLT